MNDIFKDFEIFGMALLPFVLSIGACLTRQARHGWQGVRNFIKELIICSFMGIIIYWGLDYFNLPPTVDAAITSGCSYASLVLLDALTDKMASFVRGFHVPGVENENNNR